MLLYLRLILHRHIKHVGASHYVGVPSAYVSISFHKTGLNFFITLVCNWTTFLHQAVPNYFRVHSPYIPIWLSPHCLKRIPWSVLIHQAAFKCDIFRFIFQICSESITSWPFSFSKLLALCFFYIWPVFVSLYDLLIVIILVSLPSSESSSKRNRLVRETFEIVIVQWTYSMNICEPSLYIIHAIWN